MLDSNVATPAHHFTPVDILTLIALVAGPAIAVGIQLWFERRREAKRSRLHILRTLMAFRGRLQHPDSVGALNSIELVFSDEKNVLTKLKELLEHMDAERHLPENDRNTGYQRREDLLVELISTISESLGYRFAHTAIKRRAYLPQGMIDETEYQLEMRKRMLNLTQTGSLPVKLVSEDRQPADSV